MGETKDEKTFLCYLCGLKEKFDYYGRKPHFAKQVQFMHDCFIAKDPFSPLEEGLFLLLGSKCSMCTKTVCQSSECSLHYKEWYCMPCCKSIFKTFPVEIQEEIRKMQTQQ